MTKEDSFGESFRNVRNAFITPKKEQGKPTEFHCRGVKTVGYPQNFRFIGLCYTLMGNIHVFNRCPAVIQKQADGCLNAVNNTDFLAEF